jgi:uncharacterized membrane protein YhiD involved in acid resistance
MTFQDIFKSSFLENVTAASLLDMAIALALAFAVGVFIFFVYKKTYKGVMYSSTFGVTLIALTMIATLVILAVTSNVVLSLGMVGALSIVRFRSAIKDPLDIAFLFWAIGAGIVLAAGLIPLGVIGSLLIGAVLLLFVNHKSNDQPYVAVIGLSAQAEDTVLETLAKGTKKQVVKTKSVSPEGIELTVEVRLQENSTAFMNSLAAIPGVSRATLVSYNGDYMG